MINKLRRKLIVINLSLISVVLIVTFAAIYISTRDQIIRDTESQMMMLLEQKDSGIRDKIEVGPGKGGLDNRTFISAFSVHLDSFGNLLGVTNNSRLDIDSDLLRQMIDDALDSGGKMGTLDTVEFRYLMEHNEEGTKIVFADRAEELRRLSSLLQSFVFMGMGSLVAFYFISFLLARWAVKPIEKSLRQQRQFVADASHELKTPLTVILANTDIVLAGGNTRVEQQKKWLEYIKIEAQRMAQLVNDMLFLAKSDDMRTDTVLGDVNLSDAVWSALLPFESVAFEQGKNILSKIDEGVVVRGEEGKLKQLVGILVDNAVKYADDRGHITVTLTHGQDRAKLSVNNTGEPISKGEMEHIFDRFYRVDKSRVRKEEGYGLGLSIARTIVDAHGGRIGVQSTVQGGTTFTVTLPMSKSPQ